MATNYRTEQAVSIANTEVDLATVGTCTFGQILSIFICNRGAVQDAFTITLSVGGGATATKDYLYSGITIAANDTFLITTPIFIHTGDVIRVKSTTNSITYTISFTETT
jgi:hypothetical protein